MTAATDANIGTTPVREAHRFDEAALAVWMEANVEGFHGPLNVEQFKGGQSNPTYKLVTPGRAYVMRRKPPGQLLKGAHAIEREAHAATARRLRELAAAQRPDRRAKRRRNPAEDDPAG